MDARRGAMTQQMEAMRSVMSSDTFATRRGAKAQARASRTAPDDSRLPVKALTAHRVPARWENIPQTRPWRRARVFVRRNRLAHLQLGVIVDLNLLLASRRRVGDVELRRMGG